MLAPDDGRVMPGLCSIHASAIRGARRHACCASSTTVDHGEAAAGVVCRAQRRRSGWFAPSCAQWLPVAARQRPQDDADALVDAEGIISRSSSAIDQAVVVLMETKPRPAGSRCIALWRTARRTCWRRRDSVPAYFDHVVQGLHRLFDGRVAVPAVNLVEIDIIGAKATQRVVDAGHDVFAREAAVVGRAAHGVKDLGSEHHFVAPKPRRARPLTSSLTPSEYTSAVEEVDAKFEGAPHEGAALLHSAPSASALDAVGHHA